MNQQQPPQVEIKLLENYREDYANSVQIRVSLWDFCLSFGRLEQTAADRVTISNFQGVYLSPQQAKALMNVLQQNISQYEATFGELKLEPQGGASGIIQ